MKYRNQLPQLSGKPFLTDGGLETTLVFLDDIELPEFSAITMVTTAEKREHLRRYFDDYIHIALDHGVGFIFESPTWRASHGWAEALGYTRAQLESLNHDSIRMLIELRNKYETTQTPMVVSGCIGPRGDGYVANQMMTAEEAHDYHKVQIEWLADAGVDCVTAMTMNYVGEAAGIALAAKELGVPSVIAFTVETDGKLIAGQTLEEAIKAVDSASGSSVAYYMINCAHPSHFESALDPKAEWVKRIGGIRANASKCSHEELDNSEELDIGDPDELGQDYRRITDALPNVTVVGGCCGTDVRHIHAIAERQFGRKAA